MPYQSDPLFVCGACFDDDGLVDFCSGHAETTLCDFCGENSQGRIAAPLRDVIDHIDSCIRMHYDNPDNAGLAYESREGGYQGTTYDTSEVLNELGLDFPRDKNSRLREAIVDGIDNELWCEADPYALSRDQQLRFSWERFCDVVKHERRYFFSRTIKRAHPYREELYSPAETLRLIFTFARDEGAFSTLPSKSAFFRARYQPVGESYHTAGSLGPPPRDSAIQTNRMSPPGVVMTYASEDLQTALAETASAPGTFSVGRFITNRKLLILDLTRLRAAPSVFAELPDSSEYDPRPRLNFLHGVSRDISRPIARDDRVHIEYVPTQVVTEYVRTSIRLNRRRVDGIRYNSSRNNAATALVLFADQSNLVLEGDEQPDFYYAKGRWLQLTSTQSIAVSQTDIDRWA